MGKHRALGLVALVLVAAAACSSSSSTNGGGTNTDTSAHKTVGSAGGEVATSDGALTVTIPAGALSTNVAITITEISSAPEGAIGKAYEIGPSGTQFAVPVKLAFTYADAELGSDDPTMLEVATIAGGDWVALNDESLDPNAKVAAATTTHLSPYGLHIRRHGNDSGSPIDASTTDGTSSDATMSATDAGSSSDASSDAPFDATGCTVYMYQVGSCANHPPQLTCPMGTFVGSCTNSDAAQGFMLECCANDGG